MVARYLVLLLVVTTLNSCDDYKEPPIWTLRRDAILRRVRSDEECKELGQPNGCKEEFTIEQFISMVEAKEKKSIGYVLTPLGTSQISEAITSCRAELAACKSGGGK